MPQAWQLLIASLSHWAPPEGLADFAAYFLRTHAPQEWKGRLDRLLASTLHRVAAGKPLSSTYSVATSMTTFHGLDSSMPAGRAALAAGGGISGSGGGGGGGGGYGGGGGGGGGGEGGGGKEEKEAEEQQEQEEE